MADTLNAFYSDLQELDRAEPLINQSTARISFYRCQKLVLDFASLQSCNVGDVVYRYLTTSVWGTSTSMRSGGKVLLA